MIAIRRACVVLLFWLCAGCAPAMHQIVRPAVEAGIEEATERDVAREVEELLATPEMQANLQRLAQEMIVGARQELESPEWAALLRTRSADLVAGMAPALARSLETEIGPAVRRELVRAIHTALAALAAPGTQAQLTDVARVVTRAVTDTLLVTLPQTDPGRPPLRTATEQVMLGIGDALQGEFGSALHAFLDRERVDTSQDIAHSVDPVPWVLAGALLVFGPAAIALGVLLWRRGRAARRHDLAAHLLARACADRGALDALVERVEVEGNADLARYLRDLAARR